MKKEKITTIIDYEEPKTKRVVTPLSILKREANNNPYNWQLPGASIEKLFKKFGDQMDMQATEVVKSYAAWLSHRRNIHCSHMDLCRLWFVSEMGYATEEEQSQMGAEYFN